MKYQEIADKARLDMIDRSEVIGESMHWGGAFSLMEIMSVLLCDIYNKDRDVFILSKGHAAGGLYAIMHRLEMISDDLWNTYRMDGSELSELIEFNHKLGFACSGGSLGLGPSYGEGVAILKKRLNQEGHVYVVIGDGEANEGSVWEAFASIAHYSLDNFTLIIDKNNLQSDGDTKMVMKIPNLSECLKGFGWNTFEIDGHDCESILRVFSNNESNGRPTAVICNTIKGKGVSFMEGESVWHDRLMSMSELNLAREELTIRVAD